MHAKALNEGAEFFPVTGEGELPAVRVGGVLVTVYIAPDGHLVVAIAGEGAEVDDNGLMHDDGCPNLRVVVNEARVYDDTRVARTTGTAFTLYVEDAKPQSQRQRRLAELSDDLWLS